MQDERKGTSAAQLFYEKGYENTYLLSGGIEKFLEEYPEFCDGREVPISKKVKVQEEEKKKQEKDELRKKKHESCKLEHSH